MSALVFPIANPEIDGVGVRFFRSPEVGPQFPWHAVDDLYRAMELPRSLRRELLRSTQAFPAAEVRTVATPVGLVVVASHVMAQGVIGAAVEVHGVGSDFEMKYVKALSTAWDALAGDLGPMGRFELLMASAKNTLNPGSAR